MLIEELDAQPRAAEVPSLAFEDPCLEDAVVTPLIDPDRLRPDSERRQRYIPLFRRVAGVNAVLLVAAVAVTIVVLDPEKFSSFAVDEAGVLAGALTLLALVNLYLVRRVIRPLQALTALARRVDLRNPGERMPVEAPISEAGELALTFNEMLDRLSAERRDATGRVLAGQEAERLRIAQELHDQVGQELTAVLLVLSQLHARVPAELRPDVADVQDEVRAGLEDLRRIAIELRPEALDDLGLASALAVLAQRFAERSALRVTERIAEDLPPLRPEVELVIYRVAQEALTNVARHSGASEAELTVDTEDHHLVLTVRDHGRGLPAGHRPGTGMRGMRERAGLIGAGLKVANSTDGRGCEVRLDVVLEGAR
ncbi:MAG TPA: sensor histidine kinase [Solirubrobacteraceae bacterium]|nr:sensor histidine kinase [Solirubrobacteraceae bacterium]